MVYLLKLYGSLVLELFTEVYMDSNLSSLGESKFQMFYFLGKYCNYQLGAKRRVMVFAPQPQYLYKFPTGNSF